MTRELLEVAPKPKSRSLHAIGSDLETLGDILTELEGDVSDEQTDTTIDGWLNELGEEEAQKIDRFCYFLAEHEARALTIKAEIARLAKLQKQHENIAKRGKARLLYYLNWRGLKSFTTAFHKLIVKANGGKQAVRVDESISVDRIMSRFLKTKVEVDIDVVRQHLEAGNVLGFATLEPRGEHLEIK